MFLRVEGFCIPNGSPSPASPSSDHCLVHFWRGLTYDGLAWRGLVSASLRVVFSLLPPPVPPMRLQSAGGGGRQSCGHLDGLLSFGPVCSGSVLRWFGMLVGGLVCIAWHGLIYYNMARFCVIRSGPLRSNVSRKCEGKRSGRFGRKSHTITRAARHYY